MEYLVLMNREALHLCDGSKEIPLLATTLFFVAVVAMFVEDIILWWRFILARRILRNAITPTRLLQREGDATTSTNSIMMLMSTLRKEDDVVERRSMRDVDVGNFYLSVLDLRVWPAERIDTTARTIPDRGHGLRYRYCDNDCCAMICYGDGWMLEPNK
jgi:hypothetical protein